MVDPSQDTAAAGASADHVRARGRILRAGRAAVLRRGRRRGASAWRSTPTPTSSRCAASMRGARARRRSPSSAARPTCAQACGCRWRSRRAAARQRRGGARDSSAAKVRGVESQGMLCSARELGLSDDHAGILELPDDAPLGRDVRQLLALDDHVFDIKLTPNRADCLSVLGVAREVAALTGVPLTAPRVEPVAARNDARLPVRVLAPDRLRTVFRARDPRRERAGGDAGVDDTTPVARRAAVDLGAGRHLELRHAGTRASAAHLRPRQGARRRDRRPLGQAGRARRAAERSDRRNRRKRRRDRRCRRRGSALAGIMGGETTAVSDDTRNIYLESAFLWPQAIAGRARRYNFTTDAAHRFERGVDFANDGGAHRAHHPADPRDLRRRARTDRRHGHAAAGAASRCACAWRARRRSSACRLRATKWPMFLRALRCPSSGEGEAFVVTPPSYRFDLEIEEDLIEEVARVHGFERIPAHPPRAPARMSAPPEARRSLHALRERLAACDYQEVINFSFVEPVGRRTSRARPTRSACSIRSPASCP